MLVISPEKQNHRGCARAHTHTHTYIYIYREREREREELSHAIRGADKSQDLQSASWRPSRANGIDPI